jgi:hypothetical protein
MSSIKTYPLPNSTILRLYSESEIIKIDPEYQRKGDIWTKQKKQLLIDSILNDYDIPKLYFHAFTEKNINQTKNNFRYAIIDGRQRIEAIWQFIEGEFPISEDFEFFEDSSIQLNKLKYEDLAIKFPKLKIRFDSFVLPVILVETDDIDLIEDMFSRLNEAVPLNAAEKRNAIGGPMAKLIRELGNKNFFINKVRFNNSRYQHREVAARLLFLIYSINKNKRILDTKKPYLDEMVKNYKENPENDPNPIYYKTLEIMEEMERVFSDSDNLLSSQSSITVYFLVFKQAKENGTVKKLKRKMFEEFYSQLAENRILAEKDITKANYDFLEFERLTQQGTNDATSIRERTRILSQFLSI